MQTQGYEHPSCRLEALPNRGAGYPQTKRPLHPRTRPEHLPFSRLAMAVHTVSGAQQVFDKHPVEKDLA